MRVYLFCISLAILLCSSAQDSNSQITWPQSGAMSAPPGFETPDQKRQDSYMSGQILGSVMTADNQAVPYATISMWSTAGAPLEMTAAADGRFDVQNLRAGHYVLSATVGLREARAEVDVREGVSLVTLTIPQSNDSTGDGKATISAAQLAVPDKARREFQKAQDSVSKNKFVEAASHLERALTFCPRYAEALVLRAILERSQNSLKLAQADAEKAVEYDPHNGQAYIVLAASYIDLQRWDDAIRSLNHGVALAPTYWPGHYEMSRAMLAKGNFAEALRQAEKASTVASTNYAPLHLVKGYAYLGLGNNVAAGQELEVYLKQEPSAPATPQVRKTLDQLHACSLQKQDCDRNTKRDLPVSSTSHP
jgi:tetratricopeptide (TPR) repeat protein